MLRHLAFAVLTLLPLSLAAEETPQASGTFEGSKFKFDVKGAYAYWSRSSTEGPLIEVAVSNDGFIASAFDTFYDPKPVIENDFADDKTAVLYFQFEPNGKYHGMSYYLGSGDGCGFCYDPGVKSNVSVAANRAKGGLKFKGENRSFDIQFDVPIAPKEWGTPIKGDGGDIGGAYKAYNNAMNADDRKAIFDLLDAHTQEFWKKREKEGKLDSYLDYRADKVHYRIKDARIVRGYVRENQAVLLIRAASPVIDHLHGQVVLTKESGRWKISDEVYEVGE